MSEFSADWLTLREPLDAASRAASLATLLVEHRAADPARPSPLKVIDLGAGTGANLRYLAPLLGGSQEWLLVDRDPLLLEALHSRMRGWAQTRGLEIIDSAGHCAIRGARFDCHMRGVSLDLATQFDQLALGKDTLITASALLDLVSQRWLQDLADRAASAAATVWFALTYDGRIKCSPAEPEDAEVRELFNAHQLTDKGFGSALGPGAARMAEQLLLQHGYRVHCAPSDWHVGTDQPALQRALVAGWFNAACEIEPRKASALRSWLARRRAHIDGARSQLRVGHVDLMATASRAAWRHP